MARSGASSGYMDEDDNIERLDRRKDLVLSSLGHLPIPRHPGSDPAAVDLAQRLRGCAEKRGSSRDGSNSSRMGDTRTDSRSSSRSRVISRTTRESDFHTPLHTPPPLRVTRPLEPEVETLLYPPSRLGSTQVSPSRRQESGSSCQSGAEAPAQRLLRAIEAGKRLASDQHQTVQLTPNIIVKFGEDIDLDEADTMTYIKREWPSFLMPKSLGTVSVGTMNYHFTSSLEGVPLNTIWTSLSVPARKSVQKQLESILHRLRALPPPRCEGTICIGAGTPVPRCKDFRRHVRIAPHTITNETDFNKFLLSSPEIPASVPSNTRHGVGPGNAGHVKPRPRGSPNSKMPPSTNPYDSNYVSPHYLTMLRSQMRFDHRLVLTHGDIRPENIMVTRCTPDNGSGNNRPGSRRSFDLSRISRTLLPSGSSGKPPDSRSTSSSSGNGNGSRNNSSSSKPNETIKITGLIGWADSGVYPEYWEYVRALYLFHPASSDDWWGYLPTSQRGMGEYVQEYLVDDCIDRLVRGEERVF